LVGDVEALPSVALDSSVTRGRAAGVGWSSGRRRSVRRSVRTRGRRRRSTLRRTIWTEASLPVGVGAVAWVKTLGSAAAAPGAFKVVATASTDSLVSLNRCRRCRRRRRRRTGRSRCPATAARSTATSTRENVNANTSNTKAGKLLKQRGGKVNMII